MLGKQVFHPNCIIQASHEKLKFLFFLMLHLNTSWCHFIDLAVPNNHFTEPTWTHHIWTVCDFFLKPTSSYPADFNMDLKTITFFNCGTCYTVSRLRLLITAALNEWWDGAEPVCSMVCSGSDSSFIQSSGDQQTQTRDCVASPAVKKCDSF